MVASPCIRLCALDRATGLCAGCGRTIEEIAGWSRMSDEERRMVIARLAERTAPAGAA
ncbi:DUF1289 domain-containing protein [Prosthecomicrobium pneumaticum]|uniref:Fe-S oxidoreductase n=1 Tax=Prosthecomicrobium pneumaticum TaxID=81895 RepID=A0A7W9FPR7_9HYPH|nr:DUF1289 domain-containing protein [Prosthecomicrobium pneumaticum]MBB5754617.1 hypothetical protein [Prosthecomicrobium pneumaticum]